MPPVPRSSRFPGAQPSESRGSRPARRASRHLSCTTYHHRLRKIWLAIRLGQCRVPVHVHAHPTSPASCKLSPRSIRAIPTRGKSLRVAAFPNLLGLPGKRSCEIMMSPSCHPGSRSFRAYPCLREGSVDFRYSSARGQYFIFSFPGPHVTYIVISFLPSVKRVPLAPSISNTTFHNVPAILCPACSLRYLLARRIHPMAYSMRA